ncbi:hypothetical protein HRTV-28_gp23 [Halorubrum tailed virus 28]|uniref:Uncharacterized protein n=1 Tax=Halorubrum tailed virus 28 TaxID=2878009 RepID=A0AAE8XZN1_9CAUD|nr:hypothetical protein M1M39_gp24 [Halorubrum tailed virus 28]UBF23461.1 hypothetical protein HRTV-28_gp23 [Halorubrum tailed virus 28]
MTDFDDLRDLEVDHRIEERTHQWAREFVEYVIEQATHRLELDAIDEDAFVNLFHEIHLEGHRMFPPEREQDGQAVSVFLHPADRDEFRADLSDVYVRHEGIQSPGFNYRGARVYGERHLDRGTVLVVHEDAVAPPPSFAVSERPWFVRDPSAVAVGVVDE